MKLILHIGTPKTASTLLQNSLEANPDWLARYGAAYGRACSPYSNHLTLCFAVSPEISGLSMSLGIDSEAAKIELRRQISAEIAAHLAELPAHIDHYILSSENLTGNLFDAEGIARLHDMLAPLFDEIEIVVYVRRQDDAILSMYAEHMRQGFSNAPFDAFVDRCCGAGSPVLYLYYRRELLKWIEVWGRGALTVRLFESSAFAGGDILSDFLGVALGRSDLDLSDFVRSDVDNRSRSAPVLEALRRLQPAIPFLAHGRPNELRARLTPYIYDLPTEPRPVMAPDQARAIMHHFRIANGWLRETFFPDRPDPLFPPRPDLPAQGNLGALSDDDYAEIVSRLLLPALR